MVVLSVSKVNRILRVQKLNRLKRIARVIEDILEQPDRYLDLKLLIRELAMSLKAKPFEKTIVFAAKMAYYTFKTLGYNARLEEVTVIPVDKRIALLTVTSGLLDTDPKNIVSRYRDTAIGAWREIARLSNIPLLRLDAIVWLPARGLEKLLYMGRIEAARDEFARKLSSFSSGLIDWQTARDVAKQILYRLPP
ncbi:MAG TPA: N-glycosylase/DNA lyase [Pyrodictiaceae archaeon]|nr:N-glycosylase/DNA lyase [Pyrodictiaceae archaeon]